jgi:hypothetical protein
VSLFGLLTATLLSFGFVSVKTGKVVDSQRDARYAADGALDGAIKRFQKMRDDGVANPCANNDPFYTFTVHGHSASANCTATGLGGTANPVQSLLPSGVSSSDFVPYNTNTSKTLLETLQYMESANAPGYGGGLPSGTTAYTTYPHGSSPNTATFTYGAADPAVGNTFQQVLAIVSHREGTGPGDAPSQDQWLTITTRDSVGGPVIDCNANGTKYSAPDAKASGGPAWPIPPYQTIDVTYQLSTTGGITTTPCLNTRERVQNASITYNATCTSGCGSLQDSLDSVTICVCLRARPSTAVSNPTCPQPLGETMWIVNGGNLTQQDCTQGHNPVAVGQPATPDVGIFQPADPTLVGRVSCGPTSCTGSTHTRFPGAALNTSHSLTLTGWSWPAIGPVVYVTLRVSHTERRPNLVPTVTISFPGSNCPDPISLAVSTSGYAEYAGFLPTGCAPDTQAKMNGLTLTYTVTCQSSYLGVTYPACGGGGDSNPYAFLDAITLDLEYELGGSGGTPVGNFVSTAGGTTVSANATFNDDGTIAVDDYQVT